MVPLVKHGWQVCLWVMQAFTFSVHHVSQGLKVVEIQVFEPTAHPQNEGVCVVVQARGYQQDTGGE